MVTALLVANSATNDNRTWLSNTKSEAASPHTRIARHFAGNVRCTDPWHSPAPLRGAMLHAVVVLHGSKVPGLGDDAWGPTTSDAAACHRSPGSGQGDPGTCNYQGPWH